MSYNIKKFEVFSKQKKIRLSGIIKEDVENGYYPPHYDEADWEKWISKKSSDERIVVFVDGDYGQFIEIYEKGKKIKEVELRPHNLIKDYFI